MEIKRLNLEALKAAAAYGALLFLSSSITVAQTYSDDNIREHDFNDGRMGPFIECTVKSPNYSKVVNNRVETYWEADAYDGSRTSRGAEFCEVGRSVNPGIELRTKKHYWSGFTLNIDSGHSRTSSSAIAQTMGYRNWDSSSRFNTWTLLLSIINGDLVVDHRAGAGSSTQVKLVDNFSFGVDHDIVIGQVFSGNNNGKVEVWVDGVRLYQKTGISNGMGPFDSNDEQGDGQHSAFKLGMYNHTTGDYKSGEKRIVYYDNVTWYTGPNGYSVVDPSDSDGPVEEGTIKATASSDDGNGPANVLDNNLGTRWSAFGDGQWLQLDLGSSQALNGVELAFFKGNQRNAYFDVQTSSNGSSWNTVLSNQTSSGNTLQLESFSFPTVNARYLRYLGDGNSSNSWNSLTEVVAQVAENITASASLDDDNEPANVLDNNLGTRWSAFGDGQWLQLDLGSTRALNGIQLAFFKGDQRNAYFDIQVSSNGSNWNTVLSNQSSSGNTLQLESFSFSSVNARYIRYVGSGNSSSSWNSLTEAVPY